jgi:hypothetical protein
MTNEYNEIENDCLILNIICSKIPSFSFIKYLKYMYDTVIPVLAARMGE